MPGQRTMRDRATTLLRGGKLRVAQKRNPTKAACAWWGAVRARGEKTRRGGSLEQACRRVKSCGVLRQLDHGGEASARAVFGDVDDTTGRQRGDSAAKISRTETL
jgi:hypothetical protein